MRRNSLQHIARGSEGALFFQWRAAKSGAEKYHSAMLPHAGTSTRRWQEVVSLGRDLQLLKDVADSTVEAARVAILFDWNSWWAAELDSHPTEDFSVMHQIQRWHHRLWELNIGVDFVHPNDDYSSYAVVLIPGLYLMDDDAVRRVREFVNAGGCLLAGYFSGIVDEHDHVRTGGYPGALKDVLGITVEEFNPLTPGQDVQLSRFGAGTIWSETCTAQSAQPLAYYTNGSTAGSVAISHNRFGAGHAFYLGTELTDSALPDLIDAVLDQAGLDHRVAVHAGVEIVHRCGLRKRFSFIINHSDEPALVTIPGRNLLGDNSFAASITVDAGAVAVVESDLQPS